MRTAIIIAICVVVSACSGRGGGSIGPDPFSVVPQKPLEMPQAANALPTPTPGGTNLADINPIADAAKTLGGTTVDRGIPASDSALVAYAGRNGRDAGIRDLLRQEDAGFRKRLNRVGFFGGIKTPADVYRRMVLNAYAEFERFKALGIATPTAPPR